jgi:hypothetical protein
MPSTLMRSAGANNRIDKQISPAIVVLKLLLLNQKFVHIRIA